MVPAPVISLSHAPSIYVLVVGAARTVCFSTKPFCPASLSRRLLARSCTALLSYHQVVSGCRCHGGPVTGLSGAALPRGAPYLRPRTVSVRGRFFSVIQTTLRCRSLQRTAASSACETPDAGAANGRFGFWPYSLYRIAALGKLCCTAKSRSTSRPEFSCEICCNRIGRLCPHSRHSFSP